MGEGSLSGHGQCLVRSTSSNVLQKSTRLQARCFFFFFPLYVWGEGANSSSFTSIRGRKGWGSSALDDKYCFCTLMQNVRISYDLSSPGVWTAEWCYFHGAIDPLLLRIIKLIKLFGTLGLSHFIMHYIVHLLYSLAVCSFTTNGKWSGPTFWWTGC